MKLTSIDLLLETRLFIFVISGLLLFEFCPIRSFCQQRDQPTITDIHVIWSSSYIISTLTPRFCYFVSRNINNNFHLGLCFTYISPQYWRFAQFGHTIWWKYQNFLHCSRIFFTSIELTGKENLKFTGQPWNLFLNSINVYKNLNSSKKF